MASTPLSGLLSPHPPVAGRRHTLLQVLLPWWGREWPAGRVCTSSTSEPSNSTMHLQGEGPPSGPSDRPHCSRRNLPERGVAARGQVEHTASSPPRLGPGGTLPLSKESLPPALELESHLHHQLALRCWERCLAPVPRSSR